MELLVYLIGSYLIAGLVFLNRKKVLNYVLVTFFIILQWFFTIVVYLNKNKFLGEYFITDSLGVLFLIVLSIILLPAFFYSILYIERHNETNYSRSIYFTALIVLINALSLGYLANHIVVFWIFMELTTLSSAAIIYHHRNKLALEGTWKYVFIGAISAAFVFIGILFLSLAIRNSEIKILSYSNIIENINKANIIWLKFAFIFMYTGYTFKANIFPMYNASIDAKDKAPAPTGALLASVLMNLGFIGIFRLYGLLYHTELVGMIKTVLIITAISSLFISAVYMISVKNLKRMLAYSGLEHMSLAILGIAFGGIGYFGAILHLVFHSFIKSGLFFQFNYIYRVFQNKNIYYIGNYLKYNFVGAISLLIGTVCLLGIPPSGLFFSELFIFKSLLVSKNYFLLLIPIILLLFIIWSFSNNIFKVLFIPASNFRENNTSEVSSYEMVFQYLLFFIPIYLGIALPDFFVKLINESIVNVFTKIL